jgi:hypothetical protein
MEGSREYIYTATGSVRSTWHLRYYNIHKSMYTQSHIALCHVATTTPFTYMTGPSNVSYAEGHSTDEQVSLLTPITIIIFSFSWPPNQPFPSWLVWFIRVFPVTYNVTSTTEATCITSQSSSLAATETLRSDILKFSFNVCAVTITCGLGFLTSTVATSTITSLVQTSTSSAVLRTTSSPSQESRRQA